MRSGKHYLQISLFLIAFSIGITKAEATTAIMMNDEDLIVSSRAIVQGKVSSIECRLDESRSRIYTYITVSVENVYKGKIRSKEIVVRQLGGSVREYMQIVYGSPQFRLGEEALLFLNSSEDGALRTAHLFMGKFAVSTDERTGRRRVKRFIENSDELELQYKDGVTNEMDFNDFQKKIYSTLKTEAKRVAEFERLNQNRPLYAVPPEYSIKRSTNSINPQFNFIENEQQIAFRWFEPDGNSPVFFWINSKNAPSSNGSLTEFERSLQAWSNIGGASISLRNVGSTSSCGFTADGISSVSFGDCLNEIDDPVDCTGILALGGISAAVKETKTLNGKAFYRIVEGDVVFNNGFDCFLSDSKNLEEALTHEIGHALGLGHSSENPFEKDANLKDAAMYFRAHADGRGASLREDDADAALFIYPLPDATRIGTFSPQSGIVGNAVSIKGANLQNPVSVKFGTVNAEILSSSEGEIVAKIPQFALTGKITVETAKGIAISKNHLNVIRKPVVSAITPLIGTAGTTVTITGLNLTGVNDVKFNGASASSITAVSQTAIKVVVPEGAGTGNISLSNIAGSFTSGSVFKTLPKITEVSPGSAKIGETVAIRGYGLKDPKTVRFGPAAALVISSSETEISAVVPQGALTGKISVTTTSGTSSSSADFVVIKR